MSNNANSFAFYSASGASAIRRVPFPQAAWVEMSELSVEFTQSQSAVSCETSASGLLDIVGETSSRY